MKIAIDARPLSHPQAGGYRSYLRALVQGLGEIGGDDSYLLYLDRPLPLDAPRLAPNVETRILGRRRLIADAVLFRRQVRRDRPDLVHGTTNGLAPGISAPTTVTVHDALQIKRYPFVPLEKRLRGRMIRAYEASLCRASTRRAGRIITVSHGSAAEIRAVLGIGADRIRVVHNGVTLCPVFGIARSGDTVLALAATDPRKNIDILLRALAAGQGRFKQAPRVRLVCSNDAAAAAVAEAARQCGIDGIDMLCRPTDTELAAVYAEAALFVFPSLLEGFGLPPLEAMLSGCPVISSHAPAMPEVLGDAPLWFDPEDPEELTERIASLLEDAGLRKEVARRGRDHASQFTCRRMAEQTRAVWQEALG